MLREMDANECEALLRSHRIGRLAMRDAEGVGILPFGYAFHEGALYGHASPGRKLALLHRWPHVAFEVDEIADPSTWRSVVVRGRWEELTDPDEQFRARAALLKAFDGSRISVTAGHGHSVSLADAIMFRIRIEELTGRAENA